MKEQYPSVSVIISTYNRSKMLARALDSVLAQGFRDYEVIVVDDASTDDTDQVLAEYHDKFATRNTVFRAMRLKENSGYQSVPKNYGIYMASGDYIAYLDDDNEWTPNHLSLMMEEFDKDLSIDLVYCWRKYVGKGPDVNPHPDIWDNAAIAILCGVNSIDTSDIIHSRGVAYVVYDRFDSIWNENDRRYGDATLLRRLAQVGCKGKLVPQELSIYHWHDSNLMKVRPVGDGYAAVGIDVVRDAENRNSNDNKKPAGVHQESVSVT